MSKSRYKITITNWQKHQKKLKAGHTHFMLSKRFFDDENVSLLKQNECLLFINLLVIAADLMSDSFIIHTKLLPNLLRVGDKSLQNCLARLQSFQLVTYEKVAPNIIEDKIIEDKIKKDNSIILTNNTSSEVKTLPQRGCHPVFCDDKICFERFLPCSIAAQQSWIDAYEDIEFIKAECRKANAWILSNPKKAPKVFQRFFANWLSRAFESYRKGLPSRRQTNSELNIQVLRELHEKNQKGEL